MIIIIISSSILSPLCRVYSRDKPCPQGVHCCSHSIVAVYGASISSSYVGSLYFYVSTFRSMCAVPSMAVFCSSLTSWCPGMFLTCFLNDLEIVPVTPITTGITLVFTFHIRCISIVRSLLLLLLLLVTTLMQRKHTHPELYW